MTETSLEIAPGTLSWLGPAGDELRDELKRSLQWFRYRLGQPLLQADRLPHQVIFIADGQVRLVGHDPVAGPFTLANLGPGDAIGWVSLLRQIPCETALAMEPVLVAALPARQFLELWKRHPGLQALCAEPTLAELADLLLPWLVEQPRQVRQRPALLTHLWSKRHLRLAATPQGEDLWLESSPGRWLGIPQAELQRWMAAPAGLWEQALEAAELPDPLGPELGARQRYHLPAMGQRGEGRQATAMICLQRLADKLRFPFPRDSVLQVLEDCEQRLGGLTLLHLGQLLEGLGLEVRPLSCGANDLFQLETPVLLQDGRGFALLEHSSSHQIVLADPSQGLLELNRAEARQRWPESQRLLVIRRQVIVGDPLQPDHLFDLAWFWGAMQPYRGQLLLLLLTGIADK